MKNAKNLESSWVDKIDPYIEMEYAGETKKSKTHDNNENPEFNEEIVFELKDDQKVIKLKLMDSNVLKDSEYGHIEIDISKAMESKEAMEEIDIKLLDSKKVELKKGTVSYSISVTEGK